MGSVGLSFPSALRSPPTPPGVVRVHHLGDGHIGAGVKALEEFVALIAQVRLDLEAWRGEEREEEGGELGGSGERGTKSNGARKQQHAENVVASAPRRPAACLG